MKTIRGLKVQPSLLEEEPGINNALPIFRIMLKTMVGKSLAKSGDDAIERYQLGLKLLQDEDEIELEDAEFKLLQNAVSENQSQIAAHYHAQLMLKLKDAEKEAEELKRIEEEKTKTEKAAKKAGKK